MDQDSHPAEQEQTPPEQPPVTSEEEVPHPLVAEKQPEAGHRDTDDTAERAILQALQRSTVRSNWVIAGATLVITVATALQVCLVSESNENAVTANEQILDEMRKTNALTSGTLEESKRQFNLSRADSIAEGQKTEQRFRDTMRASREESAASLGIAQRQLEQASRSLEISEGAELVVTGIEFVGDLRSDPQRVMLTVKNTGASAAERIAVSIRRTDLDNVTPDNVGVNDDPDVNPLPPNGIRYPRFSFSALSGEAAPIIEAGGIRLRYLGNVTYGDKLRQAWPPVPFCYIWHAAEKHFDRCFESDTR